MPRKARELSAVHVNRLRKQPGTHAVGGVAGLLLQVTDNNAASWLLRATLDGRRREFGLGSFDTYGLSDARERARAMRAKLDAGIDPVSERRAQKDTHSLLLSFDDAAKNLITSKRHEWKNSKHADQWANTLTTYASPKIGRIPVGEVELRHIVDVLTPIWTEKTETATRVRGRIEAVLDWATVSGYRSGDNPARWRGNLEHVLAKPNKVRKVEHHRALPVSAMPEFMATLRAQEGVAPRALELAILTATRSQEVRGARWEEIDLDEGIWTVPAARMKAGKLHRIPLSPQALKLLKQLPRERGLPYLFGSPRGGMLSDMALSAVTRRMGVDAVPHGFRSTFRDWTSEHTNYPREVAEMALAHAIDDKVEAAYRRGDLFAKRSNLMADWAKFLEAPPAKGNVTPIRKKASG